MTWKWHYRVKTWGIFNKGQFTHVCQLNVSCGQDSVSGIVRKNVTLHNIFEKLTQLRRFAVLIFYEFDSILFRPKKFVHPFPVISQKLRVV
jgi:hypothetical protein